MASGSAQDRRPPSGDRWAELFDIVKKSQEQQALLLDTLQKLASSQVGRVKEAAEDDADHDDDHVEDGEGAATGSDSPDDAAQVRQKLYHSIFLKHSPYLEPYLSRVMPILSDCPLAEERLYGITYTLSQETVDSLTMPHTEHIEGCVNDNWKYLHPFYQPKRAPVSYLTKYHAKGGGYSNYVAPWQLKRISADGDVRWYHVDDTAMESEVPFRVSFTPHEYPSDEGGQYYEDRCIQVPYALTPPIPLAWRQFNICSSGISEDFAVVRRALGDLFSVPPDGRLHLRFESNELRFMSKDNSLKTYLASVSDKLKDPRGIGGKVDFFVTDFDHNMDRFSYYFTSQLDDADLEATPHFWKAAKPALMKERNGFYAPPTRVSLQSIPPCDAERYKGFTMKQLNPPNGHPEDTHSPRQWYRFICLRGFVDIVPRNSTPLDARKLWGLLFYDDEADDDSAETPRPRWPHGRKLLVQDMFNRHLACSQMRSSDNTFKTSWRAFQVSWFQLFPAHDSNVKRSFWKSGPFYQNEDKLIQKRCFTVLYLPHNSYFWTYLPSNDNTWEGAQFWTILLLAPPTADHSWQLILNAPSSGILQVIQRGLKEAADAWDLVLPEFDAIIGKHSPILQPREHDALLFDDDSFSRSRLYFWALNCLETFQEEVGNTLHEWRQFWEAREAFLRFLETKDPRLEEHIPELVPESFDTILLKVQAEARRLQDQLDWFKTMHDKVHTLREALFNASSVMESRASTRLGENVKLLTYVSIFYLPLGFCVALWSVNESYSKMFFGITSLLVGGLTYFIVANLKNLTALAGNTYLPFRGRAVRSMGSHPNARWREKGQKFDIFQFRRRDEVPSEWFILGFLLAGWPMKWWRTYRERGAAREAEQEKGPEVSEEVLTGKHAQQANPETVAPV